MTFRGGEIYEAAFAEQVNLAAAFQRVFIHERANFALAAGQFFERGDINFHVEVAGVADDGAGLHGFEMLVANDALVAGNSDVHVAFFHGFGHGHHAEAIHHGFDALDRIDFGDDDIRAQTLGAHGHAASAPAIAGDDNFQSGDEHVGRADDAVNGGLAGAVAIVEEMLGHGVVDGHDRDTSACRPWPWRAGG